MESVEVELHRSGGGREEADSRLPAAEHRYYRCLTNRNQKEKLQMAKMKAVQVPKAGADFEIVEREIPQPGAGQVRIRVQACGICHSDVVTKEGLFPGISYPRVPGHEVAGVIDELGAGVKEWRKGERVGVGWHGGQDGTCLACRRGDFVNCANGKICGNSYDGGYQEYMVAAGEALARMPELLYAAEAAPLMCAGVTTFNALRHSGALPSDLVAIQGIGGLAHFGGQFAHFLDGNERSEEHTSELQSLAYLVCRLLL